MLKVIQIISILQGLFLSYTLFRKRHNYKAPGFWLFIGCILSVVLFSLGDDDYNLFLEDSRWFAFHEPLMITFFFLLIRYLHSGLERFKRSDWIFFLPYILYLGFEFISDFSEMEDNLIIESMKVITELSFIGMLIYTIYEVIRIQKAKWLLLFLIPFTLIFVLDQISDFLPPALESIESLDSYGVFMVSILLFYFVTFRLIEAPLDLLPSMDTRYQSSNISKQDAKSIEIEMNRLMVEEKLFKNPDINVNELASTLGISRQQLSEILNLNMNIRFQDYINQHRIEEFITILNDDKYSNYTLFGIATEVGFSSKSSFNATFKKMKGMTPSQFKKRNSKV